MLEWIAENGGWAWIAGGLALLGIELVAPGAFAIWAGLAALSVGVITLADLSVGWWGWQSQVTVFAVLSVMFAFAAKRTLDYGTTDGDDGDLNQPARRLVGRTGPLLDPISGGEGRVKLGDTLWRVQGPDMPAGSRVRVVGEDRGTLLVEPVDAMIEGR